MDPAAQIAEGITISRGNNGSALAAAAFLAYDTLLCLDRDIQHIWKARWSPVKVLYIVSRYYGLAHVIAYSYINFQQDLSVQYCRSHLWWFSIWGSNVFTGIVNAILILRLVALYNKSLKVIIALVTLFLAELAVEFWSTVSLVLQVIQKPVQLPSILGIPMTGCLWEPPDARQLKLSLIAWSACLAMSVIFFIMTIYPFFQNKSYLTLSDFLLRPRKVLTPVLVGFVTDGAIFFMVIFMIVLVNTVLSAAGPTYLSASLSWIPTIYSFASTRLVLSLKTRASREPTLMSEDFADTGSSQVRRPQDVVFARAPHDIGSRSNVDFEMVKLEDRS